MNHLELRQLIDRLKVTAEAMTNVTNSAPNWIPDGNGQAFIKELARQGHGILSEIEAGIPLDPPVEQSMNEERRGCPTSGG